MKHVPLALILLLAFALASGFAETAGTVRNEEFLQKKGQSEWKTIAVLPFTGPLEHARVFSEYFSVRLLQQHRYVIVSPAVAEIELNKKGSLLAKGIHTVQEAREAGRLLDADAVIIGSVGQDYSFQLEHGEGVIRTRLIDTATGEQIVEITRTSPVLFTRDQHRHMTAATENAAADMLSLLRLLSGEIISTPVGTGEKESRGRMP